MSVWWVWGGSSFGGCPVEVERVRFVEELVSFDGCFGGWVENGWKGFEEQASCVYVVPVIHGAGEVRS